MFKKKKKKILVVCANSKLLAEFKRILQNRGYSVMGARDFGKVEDLGLIMNYQPQAVLAIRVNPLSERLALGLERLDTQAKKYLMSSLEQGQLHLEGITVITTAQIYVISFA